MTRRRPLGHKILVDALLGAQLLMGAPLHDAALVQHQDLVSVADGLQPVGDHQHRFLPGQCLYGSLELILILRVHIGGGLIENDYGGVLQQASGDGDALFLTAGEGGSALADHRVVSIR